MLASKARHRWRKLPTRHQSPAANKIETQLGWAPTIEFESGLEAAVRWYIDNEAWWMAVFAGKGELQVNWA